VRTWGGGVVALPWGIAADQQRVAGVTAAASRGRSGVSLIDNRRTCTSRASDHAEKGARRLINNL
jgi:hypothetical protein